MTNRKSNRAFWGVNEAQVLEKSKTGRKKRCFIKAKQALVYDFRDAESKDGIAEFKHKNGFCCKAWNVMDILE